MSWLKRASNEGDIAVVTSDGRTVANGNRSFETPEVKALLEAIREGGIPTRLRSRLPRRNRRSMLRTLGATL